jgi:hypothetical protein
MDHTSIIILAVAIAGFILIAFFLRSGKGRGKKAGETGPVDPAEEVKEEEESIPHAPRGAHALHIPAAMLEDRRNAYIHGKVEEAVRDFQKDEGGEHTFLYIYTKSIKTQRASEDINGDSCIILNEK